MKNRIDKLNEIVKTLGLKNNSLIQFYTPSIRNDIFTFQPQKGKTGPDEISVRAFAQELSELLEESDDFSDLTVRVDGRNSPNFDSSVAETNIIFMIAISQQKDK